MPLPSVPWLCSLQVRAPRLDSWFWACLPGQPRPCARNPGCKSQAGHPPEFEGLRIPSEGSSKDAHGLRCPDVPAEPAGYMAWVSTKFTGPCGQLGFSLGSLCQREMGDRG